MKKLGVLFILVFCLLPVKLVEASEVDISSVIANTKVNVESVNNEKHVKIINNTNKDLVLEVEFMEYSFGNKLGEQKKEVLITAGDEVLVIFDSDTGYSVYEIGFNILDIK